MLASQIIDDVRLELLETTGSFWSDTELIRLINRAQSDFLNKTRILEDEATLDLTTGRSDYPLPANWLSAKGVFHKQVDSAGNANWKQLNASSLEKMGQEVSNFLSQDADRQARPNRFWIWNKTLYIDPPPQTPDAGTVNQLKLFYTAKPRNVSSSTDSIDTEDVLTDGINAYVLWKAWTKEGELDLAEQQAIIYSSFIKEANRWRNRKNGNMRYRLDVVSPHGIGSSSFSEFDPFSF